MIREREVEEVDGDLEELDVVALRKMRAAEEASAHTLEALQAIGRARGYKAGWAWFRWQARLGKRKRQATA